MDPGSHEIAHELTDDDASDASMAGYLVANSGGNIGSVIADGAYDGAPVYETFRAAGGIGIDMAGAHWSKQTSPG